MMPETKRAELMSIPIEHLPMMWEALAPLLQKGVDRSNGEISLDELYRDAMKGEYQIWVMAAGVEIKSALATRLMLFGTGKKVCNLMIAGGEELEEWKDQIEAFEDWARAENCDELRIIGRAGWGRHMKKFGYTHMNTTIGRTL